MRIRIFVITLAGVLLLSLPSIAQPSPAAPAPGSSQPGSDNNKDKFESARIAFFTSRMDLTPEEAGKFWPVYNEYNKAVSEARKTGRAKFRQIRKLTDEGTASEATVKQMLMEYVDCCKKDDELERIYLDEFLKILPAGKVALMFIAEEEFRAKMIQMWKHPGTEKTGPDGKKDCTDPASRTPVSKPAAQ